MATMYSLFFGVLFVAVLFLGGFGYRPLTREGIRKDRIPNNKSGTETAQFKVMELKSVSDMRTRIIDIATQEIGVKEATANNDGERVEEYLAYTGFGKGYAWCAAFVSWCFGQAELSAPRNAWSPALFPMDRRYSSQEVQHGTLRAGDLFAVYNRRLGRIDHAGLIKNVGNGFILTIEGNVSNRVVSKRRPLITVYAFANWIDRKEGK